MIRRMTSSGVRVTELLTAMSLATDLGLGQPPEHMLRAARISMRLGERLGLDTQQLATLYDVSLLTYVGCPVFGNEAATIFGDDIEFRSRAVQVDLGGLGGRMFMLRQAGAGMSTLHRARQIVGLMATNGRSVIQQMADHCAAAGVLAERLGLTEDVCVGVQQSYARWDGKGVPSELFGEGLSLSTRISHIAETCEVLSRTIGVEQALDVVRSRSGTHFDPQLVDALRLDPEAVFSGLTDNTLEELLDAEPIERPTLTERELDHALEALGDFCDLRCAFFAGHARGTANLVAGACNALQMPAAEATLARRAALVHDVGRFGVPGSVLNKPAPLNDRERERMRMHVYYVERIFDRPEPLRRVGLLAAAHHERMDGTGYYRGINGQSLTMSAKILSAADAYHAMTQPRPYRPAITNDDAARILRTDATAGRLDHVAVDAVLAAAGQVTSRSRAGGPSGLTSRETDVLRLVAQGLPNKAVAHRLGISPKTAGNHIEHIYTKLGVTSRASATMQAMRLGLVDANPARP